MCLLWWLTGGPIFSPGAGPGQAWAWRGEHKWGGCTFNRASHGLYSGGRIMSAKYRNKWGGRRQGVGGWGGATPSDHVFTPGLKRYFLRVNTILWISKLCVSVSWYLSELDLTLKHLNSSFWVTNQNLTTSF